MNWNRKKLQARRTKLEPKQIFHTISEVVIKQDLVMQHLLKPLQIQMITNNRLAIVLINLHEDT